MPLNMTASLKGDQEVMLNVTKAYFTIYADGRIVDNNFPVRFPGCGWQCINKAFPDGRTKIVTAEVHRLSGYEAWNN
jgi:hypothetical protein